jgi:hypothetical protein
MNGSMGSYKTFKLGEVQVVDKALSMDTSKSWQNTKVHSISDVGLCIAIKIPR